MNMGDVIIAALAANTAVTATANRSAVNIRDYAGPIHVTLDSAAGTGTDPTLDVTLQQSADGSTGWEDITGGAFAQVTDAGAAFETLTLDSDKLQPYIRAVDTVTGTASFARAVHLTGRKQYS